MAQPSRLQVMADRFKELGMTSHSHDLWSAQLIKYANTLPKGKLQTQLLEIANYIAVNKSLCYQDYFNYFVPKGYNTDDVVKALLLAFQDNKLVKKRLAQILKTANPNVPTDMWK